MIKAYYGLVDMV